MQIKTKKLKIKTKKSPEFIDITDEIASFINQTGIKNGQVLICSQHTTAAVKINENEPLLIQDMEKFLTRLSPKDDFYHHNDFEKRKTNMTDGECPNGHAHCQHLLLASSETLPVLGGKPQLGLWQRVFLIELDRAREREIIVQIMGE